VCELSKIDIYSKDTFSLHSPKRNSNDSISLAWYKNINFVYNGTLTGSDEIKGTMLQNGQTLELNLTRMEEE